MLPLYNFKKCVQDSPKSKLALIFFLWDTRAKRVSLRKFSHNSCKKSLKTF
jgi:hypothetical protein